MEHKINFRNYFITRLKEAVKRYKEKTNKN